MHSECSCIVSYCIAFVSECVTLYIVVCERCVTVLPSSHHKHTPRPIIPKLQALVYDILPPTNVITDYAIGLGKLSANEQFFVGAQIAERLRPTAQTASFVSLITVHIADAIRNKTPIVSIKTQRIFHPGADVPHVYVRAFGGYAYVCLFMCLFKFINLFLFMCV